MGYFIIGVMILLCLILGTSTILNIRKIILAKKKKNRKNNQKKSVINDDKVIDDKLDK